MQLTFPQVEENVENVSVASPDSSPETLLPGGCNEAETRVGGFPGGQSISLHLSEGTLPPPFEGPGVACFLGERARWGTQESRPSSSSPCGIRGGSGGPLLTSIITTPPHPLPQHAQSSTPYPTPKSQRGFNIKQTQRAPQSCALGRVCAVAAAALQIVNLNCSPDSLPPLFDFSQP